MPVDTLQLYRSHVVDEDFHLLRRLPITTRILDAGGLAGFAAFSAGVLRVIGFA